MIGYCNHKCSEVLSEADCYKCEDVDLTLCRHWRDRGTNEDVEKYNMLMIYKRIEFIGRAWEDILECNYNDEIKQFMAKWLFHELFSPISAFKQSYHSMVWLVTIPISIEEIVENYTSVYMDEMYNEYKKIKVSEENHQKMVDLFHKIIQDEILE
jgi:hypothetical protein